MAWGTTADVKRFDEAADWFQSRFPVTREVADEMADYSGPRAWTISGITQADVVQDAFDITSRAIADGLTLPEYKKALESKLTEAWGRKNSPRVQLIYRNATTQANNAGRWRQQNEPAIAALRPFLMFDATRPTPHPHPTCTAWDGTILPRDEFPADMHPQLHHGCQSRVRALREADARRRGIDTQQPAESADKGFGKVPTEAEWKPNGAKYDQQVFDEYQAKRHELTRSVERPRLDE